MKRELLRSISMMSDVPGYRPERVEPGRLTQWTGILARSSPMRLGRRASSA